MLTVVILFPLQILCLDHTLLHHDYFLQECSGERNSILLNLHTLGNFNKDNEANSLC